MSASRSGWFGIAGVVLALGCSGGTEAQQACEDYARTFADVAANRCRRGSLETNAAAFKSSARVGQQCELVLAIRDQAALETECFAWLRDTLSSECELLDDPGAYVEALPDACKGQLQLEN